MSATTLPDDVRAALLRVAKSRLMHNFIDGRVQLVAWNDFRASLTTIQSYSLPGCVDANRRRLAKLVSSGALAEHARSRTSGVRCFTAPRAVLDEIGKQAQREWEAIGYRVGVFMDPIEAA